VGGFLFTCSINLFVVAASHLSHAVSYLSYSKKTKMII